MRKCYNILIVASHGGHLTEALIIIQKTILKKHNIILVTYKNKRVKTIPYKKYLFRNINEYKLEFIKTFIKAFRILIANNIDLIVSTGSEIAIPFFVSARILNILRMNSKKIRSIFIESLARVYTPSGTGKLMEFLADIIIVQSPYLVNKYHKKNKVKYIGNILGDLFK